ncbi:peptidoglycan DD-metalloendopeptidase family protein [Zunongwangia sp. SCSIO 43204]|uniref:peptidoglycan DD-metalloendopeptidase family protein n=1 Tax=Zunongwangia sp. SCSIO 43204 TaxID=2779359 RepID=UPI001CA86EB5|nr:peptidoglycan DD-metalloendopeptidase family protein [Zunongwangia sp. SCSIO 43204]UAB86435.1 peptidoglycan DD-metalloendopeptidase family protein [Zunongwangia sp. SCSIO 43204]
MQSMKANFAEYISGLTAGFTPVVGGDLKQEDFIAIDLSANNPELLKLEQLSSEAFSVFIDHNLKVAGKKVAFGGYNEVRKLYQRSQLFNKNVDEFLNRNIHIGLDIWTAEGTDVLAVLDGEIHSFQDNANFGDYGPTIILKHTIEDEVFYSLYGHLSRKSLESLQVGQKFKAQEKIAELGAAEENGDYAPHLHFQIIRDLQENKGDYPGVASKKDLDFYLENCPDPNLLLKI